MKEKSFLTLTPVQEEEIKKKPVEEKFSEKSQKPIMAEVRLTHVLPWILLFLGLNVITLSTAVSLSLASLSSLV
jgi:hypothetical protein